MSESKLLNLRHLLLGAENLYRITAPHFCAGVAVAPDGMIIKTAPILHWAFNRSWGSLRRWAEGKGFKIEKVEPPPSGVLRGDFL